MVIFNLKCIKKYFFIYQKLFLISHIKISKNIINLKKKINFFFVFKIQKQIIF